MNVQDSEHIPGLKIIQPDIARDARGEFVCTYNTADYAFADNEGQAINFHEDDISLSRHNVLRGLHGDAVTWKLIHCLFGAVQYVVADMRLDSKAYRNWQAFELSGDNRTQILVPSGCANGFWVRSEFCLFGYKQSRRYGGAHGQFTVRWDDPALGITWPTRTPMLSARDAGAHYL
jgi:dTDP-4-dehydrorhamnose 3,5-epimerase